jgi:hypothetical protein
VIVCKVCGNKNEAGAQFCGFCGSFLEWTGESTGEQAPPTQPPTTGQPATPTPRPDDPTTVAPTPTPTTAGIPANAVICRVCGTPNEPDRVYCKKCANELAPAATVATTSPLPPTAPTAPKGGSGIPGPVLIVGAGVGVVVLGAIALMLMGGVKPSTPPSSLGPTTATSASPSVSVAPPTGTVSPSVSPSVSASPSAPPPPSGPILVVLAPKDGGNDTDIAVVQPDGSGLEPIITKGANSKVSWSPDKKRFVYVQSTGLRIANADGSNDHSLEPAGSLDAMPAWSPDGKTIAFSSRRTGDWEVYTIPAAGGAVKRLTKRDTEDRGPAWSPDGTHIAFISDRSGQRDIWVMTSTGSDAANLTDSSDADDVNPAWSPDGSTIVWSTSKNGGTRHLLFMDADGSNARNAVPATDQPDDFADFSPDGRYIAFQRGREGRQVLIADLEGNVVSEITNGSRFVRLPSWH